MQCETQQSTGMQRESELKTGVWYLNCAGCHLLLLISNHFQLMQNLEIATFLSEKLESTAAPTWTSTEIFLEMVRTRVTFATYKTDLTS